MCAAMFYQRDTRGGGLRNSWCDDSEREAKKKQSYKYAIAAHSKHTVIMMDVAGQSGVAVTVAVMVMNCA